jgi:hypothetical protein
VAAEAVKVAVCGVDREGSGLFFVKWAQAAVVLRAGFAELEIVADDADDVGLLLDVLGEVVGHVGGLGWLKCNWLPRGDEVGRVEVGSSLYFRGGSTRPHSWVRV